MGTEYKDKNEGKNKLEEVKKRRTRRVYRDTNKEFAVEYGRMKEDGCSKRKS